MQFQLAPHLLDQLFQLRRQHLLAPLPGDGHGAPGQLRQVLEQLAAGLRLIESGQFLELLLGKDRQIQLDQLVTDRIPGQLPVQQRSGTLPVLAQQGLVLHGAAHLGKASDQQLVGLHIEGRGHALGPGQLEKTLGGCQVAGFGGQRHG